MLIVTITLCAILGGIALDQWRRRVAALESAHRWYARCIDAQADAERLAVARSIYTGTRRRPCEGTADVQADTQPCLEVVR
jgi:hypothetical protein